MGRYYGMDRDKRWERTKAAYEALVCGVGDQAASSSEAIERAYALRPKEPADSDSIPRVLSQKDVKALAYMAGEKGRHPQLLQAVVLGHHLLQGLLVELPVFINKAALVTVETV